jgi:hypothetical protein
MTSMVEAKVYENVLPNGEVTDENLGAGCRTICSIGKAHRASFVTPYAFECAG